MSLNRHQIREIVIKIKTGKTEMIKKESNRVSIHKVMYNDAEIHVVYDKIRGTVVTALTPEMTNV